VKTVVNGTMHMVGYTIFTVETTLAFAGMYIRICDPRRDRDIAKNVSRPISRTGKEF